jgi:hypothetical protein
MRTRWDFKNRLLDAFGTRSHAFVDELLAALGLSVRSRGAECVTEKELNAALAALDGIRPRDESEAMLAVQMVATNRAALDMLARARHAEYLPTMHECGNLAVKLLRTYTAEIEALAKLRRDGEQTVRVEHVHVHDGAQAIVGNVVSRQRSGEGDNWEMTINPMQLTTGEPPALRRAPRCGARTRSGSPCRSPIVKGKKRCRMHGGAAGTGAPKGNRNGNWKHGHYCGELRSALRLFRMVARHARNSPPVR